MSKPLVYNYKAAEDRIARQKKLILYMGETIKKLSEENKQLKESATVWADKVVELDAEVKRLNRVNDNYRIRCRIAEADK